MNYPDNFNAVACDQMWGHDGTLADGAISDLSDLLEKVKAIPRDASPGCRHIPGRLSGCRKALREKENP